MKVKANYYLKNVLTLSLMLLLLFSCQKDEVLEEVEIAAMQSRSQDVNNQDVKFLSGQKEFYKLFQKILEEIKNKEENLLNTIDLSGIKTEKSMIYFQAEKDYKEAYKMIEERDIIYKNFLEKKLDILLQKAVSNKRIFKYFNGNQEDVLGGLEDMIWYHNVFDNSLLKRISKKLPINNLWGKVEKEIDNWLETSGEKIDLTNDPDDYYIEDEYLRLFLNEKEQFLIGDKTHTMTEKPEYNFSSQGIGNHNEFKKSVCRQFKKTITFGSTSSRRLKLKTYVRSLGLVKTIGAKVVGYKKKKRKWKRRRFNKTVSYSGLVLAHKPNFGETNCDTASFQNMDLSKTGQNRSLKVQRTWLGSDWYVATKAGFFGGCAVGGGVNICNVIP